MTNKLNIDNLYDIKITKVTDIKLYFTFKNEKYLLLYRPDAGRIALYHRKFEQHKAKAEIITSVSAPGINSLIKTVTPRKGDKIVYSQINREYFVKRLTELGLCKSIYTDRWNSINQEILSIDKQIRELEQQKSKLYLNWRDTQNRGSRILGDKYKLQAAERIKGKKIGEWCEEYKDTYGNTHNEYGGTLTDSYSLSVGTIFECTNGNWMGNITVNKKGNKCVNIGEKIIELTPKFHSLYVNILNTN